MPQRQLGAGHQRLVGPAGKQIPEQLVPGNLGVDDDGYRSVRERAGRARLLIAQATVEDITLLTHDALLARYPGPVTAI